MRHNSFAFVLPVLLVTSMVCPIHPGQAAQAGSAGVRKVEDMVIYKDDKFYSSFPSIVRRSNGELLVAFRRAPERRLLGERSTTHTDPNSYLMLVRSRDDGKSWSHEPELIYANPFGGSQDPCMVPLRDGSILCSSYGWALLQTNAAARLNGTTYSRLVAALKKTNINLNRKMLADIAVRDPKAFAAVVTQTK